MSARHLRLLLLTIAGLLVLAGPASADVYSYPSLSGKHRFVTVETSGGHAFLRVPAAARKRYAGRWLQWECSNTESGDTLLEVSDGAASVGKIGLWTDSTRLRVTYGLPDGTQLFADRDVATKVLTTNANEETNELNREDRWWEDSESQSESERG